MSNYGSILYKMTKYTIMPQTEFCDGILTKTNKQILKLNRSINKYLFYTQVQTIGTPWGRSKYYVDGNLGYGNPHLRNQF